MTIRQHLRKGILAVMVAASLAIPAAAIAVPPHEPNPHAAANCGRNIDKQTAAGTTAGGGPKAGIPAPTNCDHFFQNEGIIGSGK